VLCVLPDPDQSPQQVESGLAAPLLDQCPLVELHSPGWEPPDSP
jgi:hypothetical protein